MFKLPVRVYIYMPYMFAFRWPKIYDVNLLKS